MAESVRHAPRTLFSLWQQTRSITCFSKPVHWICTACLNAIAGLISATTNLLRSMSCLAKLCALMTIKRYLAASDPALFPGSSHVCKALLRQKKKNFSFALHKVLNNIPRWSRLVVDTCADSPRASRLTSLGMLLFGRNCITQFDVSPRPRSPQPVKAERCIHLVSAAVLRYRPGLSRRLDLMGQSCIRC